MITPATARSAGVAGGVFTALLGLLPKLTCPICWPAYTAALGALGIGFVDYTPYLLPLTATFVAVAIAALAWRARTRRSLLPLAVGVVAGALLLLGKFALESDALTYGAVGLFVGAPFLPMHRKCDCNKAKEIE